MTGQTLSAIPETLFRTRAALPLLALGIVAADLLGVYVYLGHRLYPLNPVWVYLFLYTVCFALYVYAAGRVLPAIPRSYSRYALPLIVTGAVLFRLAVVFAPPRLSTDILLYIWDGRLTLQ